MERKFWAHVKTRKAGPVATREDAIALWHESFKLGMGEQVCTGYGEFSGSFDIRWTNYDYTQTKELQKNFRKVVDKLD